ncbi:MAG: DUF4178 domain-containing protein [Vicinamibacteria bacterium]|nr:DUF4178 domain-containing protein [Vicinamibacteria bacterium]
MTRPVAACPNCSAPVTFRWSSAVQTVCGHCRSVVVRHDVDLKAVGVVADLPLSGSPIQIGTRGRFQGEAFTVTGRIVYEYEHGTWNEWHVEFADNSSGWLSDAQAEYAVSRVVQKPASLPAASDLEIGQTFAFGDFSFQLTTLTRARYRGVDGELPFEYWDKDEVLFADFRSADGHFATLDYSETPALLFLGAFVQFDELELKDLRAPDTGPQTKTAGFNCRNCGAAIELRAVELTRSVACTSCAAIQDPNDPNVLILQEAQARERYVPKIPLGTRGTLRGHAFEVIGYQYRYIVVEDEQYGWEEYLLFNREQGFRYLSEYQGHWNDITTLRALPDQATSGGRPAARYDGRTFKLFQTASATTDYVLGQFPWRVRAYDVAGVSDYIAPPLLLSAERTDDETTWSLGEYITGAAIWKGFDLPGTPPRAVGVFANQPSPYKGKVAWYWTIFAALVLLVAVAGLLRAASAAREQVFSGSYEFQPTSIDSSFVTEMFQVTRDSNLELTISTNLTNNWVYFNFALINGETGDALDFGREVSYYYGTDSDGRWSEGSAADVATLSTVGAGTYYLRVEPEGGTQSGPPVNYSLKIRRDVPSPVYYVLAMVLLLVPPIFVTMRAASFEARRWQESDFAE